MRRRAEARRADSTKRTGSGIKKILLPTDGSDSSMSAARYAGGLARVMGDRRDPPHRQLAGTGLVGLGTPRRDAFGVG